MNALPPHARAVRTTCPYCGVGCGIIASVDRQGAATISGDPAHPANFGRLCSKGSALGETLSLEQRLLHPMLRQADGSLAISDWDAALGKVADGLRTILDRDGPNAIAFYLSGQLLTEDYYVANKLMKGFLGSANVDTNSRLCMASSVAGHRRAFGADTVPGIYRDFDEADLIVLVGSNAAWCHPILHRRMIAAKNERGARLVVIDPRRTATAEAADLFLPIAPGTDTALFCGLLAYLADTRSLDTRYIAQHTAGFEDALARCRDIAGDAAATARATGLAPSDIVRFFELFRQTERVVTCYSQGVNQSAQGTDKVNAIINVHLATGRIGRPGMGPFSLTGQPNAMGGREVGGLANQLAAHMGFSAADIDRVRRFWNAPRMATREGLKAVDMFAAIEPRQHQGALGDGDKSGGVAAARRRISRRAQQARSVRRVRDDAAQRYGRIPGEAQPDWWIVSKSQAASASPRLSATAGRPIFFASTRRCRHSKMTGSATSTWAVSPASPMQTTTCWTCDVAAAGKRRTRRKAVLRRRRIFHQRPARTLSSRPRFHSFGRRPARLFRFASIPAPARSMAHHDAHRTEPAAGRAFPRTASRYSSR